MATSQTKKVYKTKQNSELDAYLQSVRGSHVTVKDIVDHFKEQGVTIGTTTVYRQLDRMVEQGKVTKYTIDETSSACYEYIGEDHNEGKVSCFHCKCEKCGKLIHLHCEDVLELCEHMKKRHGFEIDGRRTVFYGICDECRGIDKSKVKIRGLG